MTVPTRPLFRATLGADATIVANSLALPPGAALRPARPAVDPLTGLSGSAFSQLLQTIVAGNRADAASQLDPIADSRPGPLLAVGNSLDAAGSSAPTDRAKPSEPVNAERRYEQLPMPARVPAGATTAGKFPGRENPLQSRASDARSYAALLEQSGEAAQDAETSLHIFLESPEFGPLRVHLRAANDTISARLLTDKVSTCQMLQAHLPALRQRLLEAGIALAAVDVRLEEDRADRRRQQALAESPESGSCDDARRGASQCSTRVRWQHAGIVDVIV